MAGSMERLYELPPRIIHELDEELPVGVLGLDNWGYVTMGPDRNPDSMPSDGWGLYHPPEYYYYMDPPSTTTTPATTELAVQFAFGTAPSCHSLSRTPASRSCLE